MSPRGGEEPDRGHAGQDGVPVLNIANALTVLRILLVPVFVVVLFLGGGEDTAARIGAAAVFVVAGVTDRIDGELARRRGLITDFGKIADPIADKALIGAALVSLSVLGEISWWVTGLIAVRELGVTGLRFVVIRHGVIPASRGGKIKTLFQMAAILLYVLPLPSAAGPYLLALLWIAVVLTLVTGADYAVQAARLRALGRGTRRGRSGPSPSGHAVEPGRVTRDDADAPETVPGGGQQAGPHARAGAGGADAGSTAAGAGSRE